MQTAQEKSAINRMLMYHGLGRLEDEAILISQLGFIRPGRSAYRPDRQEYLAAATEAGIYS